MGTHKYSEKCNPNECLYCSVGSLGTHFCDWNSEICPEKGCYKEEAEEKEANGEVEYFFSL